MFVNKYWFRILIPFFSSISWIFLSFGQDALAPKFTLSAVWERKWQFLAQVHLTFEDLHGGSEIKRVKGNAGKPNKLWKIQNETKRVASKKDHGLELKSQSPFHCPRINVLLHSAPISVSVFVFASVIVFASVFVFAAAWNEKIRSRAQVQLAHCCPQLNVIYKTSLLAWHSNFWIRQPNVFTESESPFAVCCPSPHIFISYISHL